MQKLLQADRFARLYTTLGADTLVLTNFDGYEGISENFEWTVDALLNAGESPVDPAQIIGKPCYVEMDGLTGDVRYFHGVCTELRFLGWGGDHMQYRLVLRPWTWLLTRGSNSRVWHQKSAKDIIQFVFGEAGFSDVEFRVTKSYDPIHYCVQYQETDWDFACRMMEKWGMFFWFECSDQKHVLKIYDDHSSLPAIGAYSSLEFWPTEQAGSREARIIQWQNENRLRTAKVETDDYNYETVNTALEKIGTPADSPSHTHSGFAYYRYPTGHYDPGVGQLLADILTDAERAEAARKYCAGFAPLMHAGGAFTLSKHPVDEENVKHNVIASRHTISQAYHVSGSGASVGQDNDYYGEYEVADATLAYKPPHTTPVPRIMGSQTALVIRSKNAPNDEEIDVDDQGRILVKFHWNTKAGGEDQCSMRLRVAQLWAGSGWGGVWIPRVGMEVVVDFIGGDPDRPLVTGCVYNGNNKPPIKFPGDKTQSTIKSQSSKGGTSSANFNELRFEDKKGDEEIYIHAERDRLMIIEHDDDIEIGNNQTEKIGGSRTFELTGGDETVTLKGAPGTKDKYGAMITKGGHRTTTLELGDETLTIAEGKRTTSIKMDDKRTITDGDDIHKIEKGDQTTTIDKGDQTITVKMGDQQTKISAGLGKVQAMKSYEIKVGASSIKLEPAKITIKSVQIAIQAQVKLDAKGVMTTVEGSAMCTIKGGMVMIN
ncbi:MAG: type VI secretion system tip protein TssI/VgrG [Pseudomonadota bacterium]